MGVQLLCVCWVGTGECVYLSKDRHTPLHWESALRGWDWTQAQQQLNADIAAVALEQALT